MRSLFFSSPRATLTVLVLVAETVASERRGAATPSGRALYDRYCLACHGNDGDGRGPAAPWLWPRPLDFTRGEYKWRSTPVGVAPRDEDLAATIRWGVSGTSMPRFGDSLGEGEIAALIDVLHGFAPEAFETGT